MDIRHRYESSGIRERISGTRNADDAEAIASLDKRSGAIGCLFRVQNFARDAGP
jgi:hypothetical protein